MTVWIENPFDNLPAEGFRPQRYWLMAEAFARAGHAVTLWTSDFSHAKKAPRTLSKAEAPFRLKLVKTPPYSGNVSFKRIASHRTYAANWLADARAEARESGKPDVIVVSMPPLSTADAALAMKREFGAKIVVDVMDAWPETFYRLLPKPLRFLGAIPLLPLHAAASRAYRGADLVTGVCDAYEKIAFSYGARSYARFYHGVSIPAGRGARTTDRESRLSFVYAGNFGRGYDLSAAIKAVLENEEATLDIAGAGEREAEWRALAAHSPRIRFHGYLSGDELDNLLGKSAIGVIPLSDDTFVGLPYKLGDYAAHNLRMVTSLRGECAAILERHSAGAVYDAKDPSSFMTAAKKVQASTPDFDSLLSELDAEKIYASYVDRISALAHKLEMEDALAEARVAASEADIRAGRFSKGTADELMAELMEG